MTSKGIFVDMDECYKKLALFVVVKSVQRLQELSKMRRRGDDWKQEVDDHVSFLTSNTCELYCGRKFTKMELKRACWKSVIQMPD